MSKKCLVFNLIAGIIIIGAMVVQLVSGSNKLPYLLIVLFILSFLLQKVNGNGNIKFFGLMLSILLLLLSIVISLPRIFPFAP